MSLNITIIKGFVLIKIYFYKYSVTSAHRVPLPFDVQVTSQNKNILNIKLAASSSIVATGNLTWPEKHKTAVLVTPMLTPKENLVVPFALTPPGLDWTGLD